MINIAEVVTIVAICAAIDVVAHFARSIIGLFRRKPPEVAFAPTAGQPTPQPIFPLNFEVRYRQRTPVPGVEITHSLHPQASRISGRDARVLFEQAKHIYHPDHGVVEFLKNGEVVDRFGDL